MRGTLLGIAVVFLAATPATAAFVFGGQIRQVVTLTGPNGSPGTTDMQETTATGAWLATAASGYSNPNPPGGFASASALQDSNLGDLEISMTGDLAVASSGFPAQGYVGVAISQLNTSFTLDADMAYVSALVSTTDVNFYLQAPGGRSIDANSRGVLPAGGYGMTSFYQVVAGPSGGSFSGVYSYSLTIVPEPGGDFDDDDDFDGGDLDPLVEVIAGGTNLEPFDLTGDGLVDVDDLDQWLVTGGSVNLASGNPYLYGDANLDGFVDGSDFGFWNSNKFTSIAAWTRGDFNADGFVDGSDFGIWNGNKFNSANALSAVPEPNALVALFAVAALAACHKRARSAKPWILVR